VKTLILIPVYNEEEHIVEVIDKVLSFSDEDILVIDDGSTDNSRKILRGLDGVRLIELEANYGYGYVLNRGFSVAIEGGYEAVVTMDCDDQHEPHLIPTFLGAIRNADIVSGTRYLNPLPTRLPPPESRKRINREITEIINRVTSYALTDAFCGFKAYRVESLKRLDLDETGYGFPLQLWIQASASGLSVREMPVGLIYKNYNRRFGGNLDDSRLRLQYYKQVIRKELARISMSVNAMEQVGT